MAPGIPLPVLLGTDINDLPLNNPVMVTTKNQAKKGYNLMTNTEEGTLAGGPSELTGSNEIVKDILVIDAPNSNLVSTQEEEAVEHRREEEPTLIPQGLNPPEAYIDDINDGRLQILFWLRHMKKQQMKSQRWTYKLVSTTMMACFIRNGDQKGLQGEM